MGALLEGFRTGYDRMNQHYQQEENNRRYEQQQQTNNDRYAQGLQRQNTMDDMARQSHELQMKSGGLNLQVAQNQVDRLPQQNAYTDEIQGINKQGALLNNQAKEFDLGTAKENKDKASKEEKQVRAAQKLKAYSVSGQWDQMVSDPDFEGTDAELIFSGVGRKSAVGLADSISKQDWGSATQSFNKLYKPKLNKMVGSKGSNGLKILDVEATGFEVQEDGSVKIPVYVTTEKGKGYTSYISKLRSSDENDPHKQFNVDELIGKAASLGQLATIMESSGVSAAMSDRYKRYNEASNPQKPVRGDWKAITGDMGQTTGYFDPNTGQYQAIPETAKVAGMNPDDQQAYNEDVNKQKTLAITNKLLQMYPDIGNSGASEITSQIMARTQNGEKPTSAEVESLVANYKAAKAAYLKQVQERQSQAGVDLSKTMSALNYQQTGGY